jgi:hypothetical protein
MGSSDSIVGKVARTLAGSSVFRWEAVIALSVQLLGHLLHGRGISSRFTILGSYPISTEDPFFELKRPGLDADRLPPHSFYGKNK